MILYQRRNIPFIIRVLPAIFHPGLLILLAFSAGLFYMALREESNVVVGMYMAVAVMLSMYVFAMYSLLKTIIRHPILIETEHKALHLQEVRFNEVIDYHIPSANLDVETIISRSSRSSRSRNRTAYYLFFRDSRDPKFEIKMRFQDMSQIGQILEGIDSEKIIELRAKEKEFLSDYQKSKHITTGFRILNYIIYIIILGAIGYGAYNNRTSIKHWFNIFNAMRSPVTDNWQVESHGLKYSLTLVTDSTLNESLTGQYGRWSYSPTDTAKKLNANLKLYGANGTFNEFTFMQMSDSTAKLVGNTPEMNFNLLSLGFNNIPPPDSLTRFMLCFWPQVVPFQDDGVRSIVNALIPNSESIVPDKAAILTETQFVGILHSGDGMIYYLAAFDLKTGKRIAFEEIFRAEGCTASYDVVQKFGKSAIRQKALCDDNNPRVSYYTVDETGKISQPLHW